MARRNNSSRCEKTTSSTLKKGVWSAEEDHKLIAYINRYGIWNWNHMPKPAGLERSGKSCRLRWMNYLRPNIKHGNFSSEEEETILKLHETLGNRWSTIAAKLPGRTDNEIKNYWHTYLKKRFKVVDSVVLPTKLQSEANPTPNNDNDIDEAHKKKNISETEEGAPKGSSSKWEDEYSSNNLSILSPPHVQLLYTEDNFPSILMDEIATSTCSNQMDEENNISASTETFGQLQSLWSTSSTLSPSLAKGSDSGLWMELENNSDHHQFACDDQLWQHEPMLLPCDLYGGDVCINDWLNESTYTNWDATL